MLFACDRYNRVLPHSPASLGYCAANDPNTDTPLSHIIQTPGQPVHSAYCLSANQAEHLVQILPSIGLTQPGNKPRFSCLRSRRSNQLATAAAFKLESLSPHIFLLIY